MPRGGLAVAFLILIFGQYPFLIAFGLARLVLPGSEDVLIWVAPFVLLAASAFFLLDSGRRLVRAAGRC